MSSKKNFFPKHKVTMAEQPKPQAIPTKEAPKFKANLTPEEREEAKGYQQSELYDPSKRFVVIDSDSFSVLVIGLLQIKESELTTALLRRRQDYDTK